MLEGPQFLDSVTKKPISFHESGEIKDVNLVSLEEQIVGFEEFYANEKTRIIGRLDDQGRRTGVWEAYYENGNLWSQGEYLKGKETGLKIVWYENGKKRYQGTQMNDKPVGEWLFWDKAGLESKKTYE